MKNKLPQFNQISPLEIEPQLSRLLADNLATINTRLAKGRPFTWDNFVQILEDLDDRLNQFWAPICHLNAVINTPSLRKAHNGCLPKISDYSTKLSHNQEYYQAIESIANSPNYNSLDFAQKKVIENTLRDFKLSGIALEPDQKKKFAELAKKLSQLTTKFEENVMDATQAWSLLITDEKQLSGLPPHVIQAAHEAAEKRSQQGWLFPLEDPSYLAIMVHADSRSLRKTMYSAFVTRASNQGPSADQFDNSAVINDLLKTRLELARLLEFNNYAEYSLATKMVKDTQSVLDFLSQLVEASFEKAKTEFAVLKKFAEEMLSLPDLAAWDIAYTSEKLRKTHYHISQEDLRPYFPEYKVLEGLFSLIKKLFDITIKAYPMANLWHPDVKCFVLCDNAGEPISYCYLDLYARENKRSGAWMDDCRSRRFCNGHIQRPIAFVICNFNAPAGDSPALFTHDDVVTLFHEWGHALQHMLTAINYLDVAGINGIPWDAVEIASQFLEHWAFEKEAMPLISEHYQSKAPLPAELFEKMHKAKNFHAALQMIRQLEFALFDFRLHMEFDPKQEDQVQHILDEVRGRIRITPTAEFDHFQNSFSHIFAGGYAAGYYSYKWAEVMASDAFSLFQEKGVFDQKTSQKFLTTFLAMGGAKEPLDLFVEFRGRKPNIDALLTETGIIYPKDD